MGENGQDPEGPLGYSVHNCRRHVACPANLRNGDAFMALAGGGVKLGYEDRHRTSLHGLHFANIDEEVQILKASDSICHLGRRVFLVPSDKQPNCVIYIVHSIAPPPKDCVHLLGRLQGT